MDEHRFDTLARSLARSSSRREFLGAAGAALLGLVFGERVAEAKKEKPPKPPKPPKDKLPQEGELCAVVRGCAAGLCCTAVPGEGVGICTRLGTDESCSFCGDICLGDERCCDGACRDLRFDNQNCGACGAPCNTASGRQCSFGVCTCPGVTIPCGPRCCQSFEYCADVALGLCCLTGNPLCGTQCCDEDEVCQTVGETRCCPKAHVCDADCCDDGCCATFDQASLCVSGTEDQFCGSNGEACVDCTAQGMVCVGGQCVPGSDCTCTPACGVGFTCCCCEDSTTGVCVDLDTGRMPNGNEAQHCGACGVQCAIGAICVNGQCLCGGDGVECTTTSCLPPDACCVTRDICTNDPGVCGG